MSDRRVTFRTSKDGGRNWSSGKERSLGNLGEYRKRVLLHRQGQSRMFVLSWRVSSPVKATCLGGTAQVTPASN